MALIDEQWDFLQDVAMLITYIARPEFNLIATGGELWRTPYQQAEYLRIGRTRTMSSRHLVRLAIDLNFFSADTHDLISDKKTLQPIGDYWEGLNKTRNRWGGNWQFYDPGHFERNVG